MQFTGLELPENIEKDLERLAPWNQYFQLSDSCYLGRFPELLEKTGRTYCTEKDPPELIAVFAAEYKKMMLDQSHQFLPNRALKRVMGDDYSNLSIMEVGCNDGMKTLHLAHQGAASVTGVEFRKDCVERAKFLSELTSIDVDFQCVPVSLEVDDFIEEVEVHDVVCSYGILHHLVDHRRHLRILKKLARKAVVFFTACLNSEWNKMENEDPRHPFKSPFGHYVTPERSKIYQHLYDEGFEMNLEVKWNPDMGEQHRGETSTYMVCLL